MPKLDRWLATIPSLADHSLRVPYGQTQLYGGSAVELAPTLDELCRRAEQSDSAAQEVLAAFIPTVVDPEHVGRCGELRQVAASLGLPSLGRLLRCSTPEGHEPPTRTLDRDQAEQQVQSLLTHQDGRPLTLGERRALARQPSRAMLGRLLEDPHPLVVRILLGHPLVTEEDVLRMAARRPAVAEVEGEIAKRYPHKARVRLTVVLNPGTPLAVGVPLLGLLSAPELRQVIRATDLAAVVRATAREIAELRPPTDIAPHSPGQH